MVDLGATPIDRLKHSCILHNCVFTRLSCVRALNCFLLLWHRVVVEERNVVVERSQFRNVIVLYYTTHHELRDKSVPTVGPMCDLDLSAVRTVTSAEDECPPVSSPCVTLTCLGSGR